MSMDLDWDALEETLGAARRRLWAARTGEGHWVGELSSSALSTATAVFAMHQVMASYPGDIRDLAGAKQARQCIGRGLGWLALHQNADGGWGDTTESLSNASTTALCWAAFTAEEKAAAGAYAAPLGAAEAWLAERAGSLSPEALARLVIDRYGEDHTFSVPILTMLALAGRLGEGKRAWDLVPALPFELAAFPRRGFKWLRLPVVSYALPALIAIGQAHHARRPSRNPLARATRWATRGRTLRLLERIQPTSGGFLEATPLTAFVAMSLAAAGQAHHPVARRAIGFLLKSVRPDGAWPIDENLAIWVTTLSINALMGSADAADEWPADQRQRVRDWLLDQQYRTEHPYTLADPGGWAWTDLPGGVPDADDTPGALLALARMGPPDPRTRSAGVAGVKWLLRLQNRDGGIPTFCRGWGKLPFDRSSPDLTAHTLRAWDAWLDHLPPRLRGRIERAISRAIMYLAKTQGEGLDDAQRHGAAWIPLWFGNQHAPNDINPTYGASRVLLAADVMKRFGPRVPGWARFDIAADCLTPAARWLASARNRDGGWGGGAGGGPSSIEETALAVEALAGLSPSDLTEPAIEAGAQWLIRHTERGRSFPTAPIGFYFARLWYAEALYPLIWTVAALEAVRARRDAAQRPEPSPQIRLAAGSDR